ncbi:hypothetical protein M407DRAFT_220655 [Tulasnella calospora MUT 4182]|uniref:TFIID subunit TAF5 NTD2 domain-containing protein n=1 Tax=Tulasnella calospora MUT 4182 TaxID=1051891 RepID=A0A0C3KG54_9AGAM|nr:hypothetical protein M407DRAFT_220655 [Tulasnella calospora MUT 4182]
MSPELLAALSRAGMTIEEALARDPTDKQRGYKELEEWVDGALDMYRPEFRPILFPMFLYFYLELVQQAHSEAAQHFFETYSPPLMSTHAQILNHLKSIKLPHILAQDEHAQRYLDEKYVIRMSRSAFGLLLGWLMEGSGGEAMGAGEGFGGEKNKRGRATIRRILNDRIIVDVTNASSTEVPSATWTENTGLISALIPSERERAGTTTTAAAVPSPALFNKERGALKLGPAPLPDGLADEATRLLKEEGDADVLMGDGTTAKQRRLGALANEPPLVSPELSELPPRPILFKQIEVKKEMERLRDARKRIRLEPAPLTASDAELGLDRAALFAKSGALPSVCAYTFHDAGDGPCSSIFSQDSSLMAAGFNESYVRIWSLKGDKLRGMRSDFNPSSIKDGSSMKKLREKHGSTTRKLIGHSAPVHGLSFDPISGSAGSPKYLLSCSSDATTRLWSLETMSNIVVYRGHQTPIWDVEWSPLGVYFATASRDRTARLWSTDRVAPLRMFAGHMSDVDCVRFHPNSLYLATGSSDTTCRLWDVQRGACVRVFMGHKGAVTAMAMSPDGKYLASASTDQSIILWDLAGGRQVKAMTGHTSLINSLSFSACSSMLVSGSCDWTVRCWDVKGPGGAKSKRDGKEQIEVDGFGLASRTNINGPREEGKLPEDCHQTNASASVDLIATFPTKRTPIINVQFTPRNLCLVSGTYVPPPEQPSTTGP